MAYPADLLEHYRAPRHRGTLPGHTHAATVNNPLCGDEVAMQARVQDGRVVAARFEGVGCAISLGAADIVAAAAHGAAPGDIQAWAETWLHERIGMVPPEGRRRCATLALDALQRALVDNHPPQRK